MGDTPWKWPYFDLKENVKLTFLEIKMTFSKVKMTFFEIKMTFSEIKMTFSEIKLNKNLKSQSPKVPKKFILRIELVKIVKMEIEKRIQ